MTTIADLTEACERQSALSLGWFETVGRWVGDEPDPIRQRWYSAAAHRHAWHAELWAERRPRIPPEVVPAPPVPADVATGTATDPIGRAADYAAAIDAMRADLDALRAATDPDLDPSTHRVIDLVGADLAELRGQFA